MPELFAVIATLLTIVVALVLLYFAVALWGVALVCVYIAIAYAVMVIRGAIEFVTDGKGEADETQR